MLKKILFPLLLLFCLCGCGGTSKDLVIVQLTDPQFGFYADNDSIEQVNLIFESVARINELNPDAVVITGDLVHIWNDEVSLMLLDSLLGSFNKNIPVFCIPGNHDVTVSNNKVDASFCNSIHGSDRFRALMNETLLLGINSSYMKYGDTVKALSQLEWLEKELSESTAEHKIIFSHHPFFLNTMDEPENSFMSTADRHSYVKFFEQQGVEYIFAGHLHGNSEGKAQKLNMITTSAIGRPLMGVPSGARVIVVSQNGVSHQYYNVKDIPTKREDLAKKCR